MDSSVTSLAVRWMCHMSAKHETPFFLGPVGFETNGISRDNVAIMHDGNITSSELSKWQKDITHGPAIKPSRVAKSLGVVNGDEFEKHLNSLFPATVCALALSQRTGINIERFTLGNPYVRSARVPVIDILHEVVRRMQRFEHPDSLGTPEWHATPEFFIEYLDEHANMDAQHLGLPPHFWMWEDVYREKLRQRADTSERQRLREAALERDRSELQEWGSW